MSAGAVVAAKKALRSSMKKTLDSLSPSEISYQSRLSIAHVVSHPVFKRARVISCYLSMPSGELDTSELVRSILKEGKILFVPRIDLQRGELDMLRVYDEADLESFPSGKWGIREPAIEKNGQRRANAFDLETPTLDLVLLPGVAFDFTLSRLGHGKGYYDRFLHSYRSHLAKRNGVDVSQVSMPSLFALSLTQQIVEESIPITERDWKLDGIFHARGLISKSS